MVIICAICTVLEVSPIARWVKINFIPGSKNFISSGKILSNFQKKKNNWKSKHEEFIRNIRYAKQCADAEKSGKVADLPPPPPSENPDYVQCPHCSRKFNQAAAERHIPKCTTIKAKPKMLKRGGGNRAVDKLIGYK